MIQLFAVGYMELSRHLALLRTISLIKLRGVVSNEVFLGLPQPLPMPKNHN